MSLVNRPATPQDMDAIIDIRVDGWYNTYLFDPSTGAPAPADRINPRSETTREWLTAAAIGSASEQLFVAELDGEVVGLIDVETHVDHDDMHSFYMRKDVRGRGMGRQLMKVALQWLVQNGKGDILEIHASEFNTRPVPFYERIGFVITETHVGNWWGENLAGEQVVYDITMQAPSAAFVLDRLD